MGSKGLRTLGQAAAVSAALASPLAAQENLYTAAQPEDHPFATEMDIIARTREEALAACDIAARQAYGRLREVIANGEVIDREGLIAILEDFGAPDGAMDSRPNEDLVAAARSMPATNRNSCHVDAYEQETASYQALSQILQDNIAALRAETASLTDLLSVLTQLEAFANENQAILQEISALRAAAQEHRISIASSTAQIEAIWARIAADAV